MTIVRRYSKDFLTKHNLNEHTMFERDVCQRICTGNPGQCRKDCPTGTFEFSEELQEPCAKMTCDCYHPNTKGKLEYAIHRIFIQEEYEEKERRRDEREKAEDRARDRD